ncbi:hypothetical protein D3C71_1612990 [compost metagenome]
MAFSLCAFMRRPRVFSPRLARKASNGPMTPPMEFCRNLICAAISASLATRTPPTMSEWPFRYLVAECMTTSAPRANGCWLHGVAKVLSTTRISLCALAILDRASMSASFISGLVGVSTHSIRVLSVIAASTAARSVRSM